jgi:hypothetical protein
VGELCDFGRKIKKDVLRLGNNQLINVVNNSGFLIKKYYLKLIV